MALAADRGAPRSVSQLKQFEKCPQAWYRARVLRVWQRPAAWLPHGSAVHGAVEWWERTGRTASLEDVQAVFSRLYAEEIKSYTRLTPNFEWWFKSGRYDGAKDIPRRHEIGKDQVRKYLAYYAKFPQQVIWIAEDGTPGIEIAFDIDLDGIPVRGFIDAVIWDEDQEKIIVRDNKTGKDPGDDFQLGVYGLALRMIHRVAAWTGDYWMAKPGKATWPFDLHDWPEDRVTEKFVELEDAIARGDFTAKPSPKNCLFCDVSYGCEFSQA
jgi:putative RecB family exonuclease